MEDNSAFALDHLRLTGFGITYTMASSFFHHGSFFPPDSSTSHALPVFLSSPSSLKLHGFWTGLAAATLRLSSHDLCSSVTALTLSQARCIR